MTVVSTHTLARATRWGRIAGLLMGCCLAAPGWSAGGGKAALPGQTWDSIKQLPDWSGMWTPGKPPPGEPSPPMAALVFGEGTPLKPELEAARKARMGAVRGEGAGGVSAIPLSNSGLCLPNGTPHNMTPVSHEYLFSPGRVTILLENSEIRRIWTDGRRHVPDDEANPSFSGDSIGHWEGKTLVVDTINIFQDAELFIGLHVTDKTHVMERITRTGNYMRIDTVVEDPNLFTKPWIYTNWYTREDREAVDYNACTLEDRAKKGDGKLEGIDFGINRISQGEQK